MSASRPSSWPDMLIGFGVAVVVVSVALSFAVHTLLAIWVPLVIVAVIVLAGALWLRRLRSGAGLGRFDRRF